MHILYAWPPVLCAAKECAIDVCVHSTGPTTSRVLISHVPARHQVVLQQDFAVQSPGLSSLRFSFAQYYAGTCIELSVDSNGPEEPSEGRQTASRCALFSPAIWQAKLSTQSLQPSALIPG